MEASGGDKVILEQVLGELASIREENRRLTARVDALSGRSDGRQCQLAADGDHPPTAEDFDANNNTHGLSRRHLLSRLAGAGAVGAGVLAVGDIFAPRAARAAAGGNMILGQANDAGTSETSVTSTVGDDPTFRAIQTAPSGIGNIGSIALAGDAKGPYIGVAGLVAANNTGLVKAVYGIAEAQSGLSVPLSPPGTAVSPPYGAVIGDTNKAPYAIAATNSASTAIYGCAFGSADLASGVPIAAVVGDTNSASNPALMGRNSNGPQLQLVPGAARPASGAAGELFEDNTGTLWLCLGNAGFRKVGGPTTAGQLHVLASPVRVYDSRAKGGPLAGGSERTITLTTGIDGTTPAVPTGAQAALLTLTVVNTGAQGFLAVFSNAVSWPGTSNINWFQANSVDATSVTSAVDSSARIKVHCARTQTDFVIDVTGYYE